MILFSKDQISKPQPKTEVLVCNIRYSITFILSSKNIKLTVPGSKSI
jgi:hypothetical protein